MKINFIKIFLSLLFILIIIVILLKKNKELQVENFLSCSKFLSMAKNGQYCCNETTMNFDGQDVFIKGCNSIQKSNCNPPNIWCGPEVTSNNVNNTTPSSQVVNNTTPSSQVVNNITPSNINLSNTISTTTTLVPGTTTSSLLTEINDNKLFKINKYIVTLMRKILV